MRCFRRYAALAVCVLACHALVVDSAAGEPALPPSSEADPVTSNPARGFEVRVLPRPFRLGEDDEIATLEAIRVALTEVADGNSYVWYREHGRLNGLVRPTASFKDGRGRVCRHIVLMLSAGSQTGRIEGIACRSAQGRWELAG